MKRFTIVCLVAMNLLCLDLVTKQLAAARLKRSAAVSVIDGFFGLAYVENRGCAWGMFQHHVWPLALFGFLALGFIVWKRDSLFGGGRLAHAAEPLLYAGILGNLVDRVCRGYVIDFFDFHWAEAYHFPCFNVADVCITLAAAFLLLSSFRPGGRSAPVGAGATGGGAK